MKFRKLLIIPAICGMVFVSCEKDNDTNNAEVADTNEVTTSSLETLGVNTDLTPTNLDQATLDLIASNFPPSAKNFLAFVKASPFSSGLLLS